MKKLNRKQVRKLVENAVNEGPAISQLEATDLIEFADAYASLGAAVQEQVKDVLDMRTEAGANPSAIEMALQRLEGFNEELDQALQEYLDEMMDDRGERY